MDTKRATSWMLAAALAVAAKGAPAQETQAPAPEAPVVTQDPPPQAETAPTPPALTVGVLPPPPAPGTVTGGQDQQSAAGPDGQPRSERHQGGEERRREWFRRMERRYDAWRAEKMGAMSEVWRAVRHDEGPAATGEASGGQVQRKATVASPAPNAPAPSGPAPSAPAVTNAPTPAAPGTEVRHDPSRDAAGRDARVARREEAPARREERREVRQEVRREQRREFRREEHQAPRAQNRAPQPARPRSIARR